VQREYTDDSLLHETPRGLEDDIFFDDDAQDEQAGRGEVDHRDDFVGIVVQGVADAEVDEADDVPDVTFVVDGLRYWSLVVIEAVFDGVDLHVGYNLLT
jgi:hypothetical protein